MNSLSRRAFLDLANRVLLAISGVAGMAGLWRFMSYAPQPPNPVEFDLGPASNYPPGSRTVIHQARAVIDHQPSGIQAYSTLCPHLGCEVQLVDEEYQCPCHGSRFNLQGELLQGPAGDPLRRLRLDVNAAGHLVLYTN